MAEIKEGNLKNNQLRKFFLENIVTIIFIVLTIIGILLSELNFLFIVNELISRISRNSFLVLSLIIPILAGLGLNFGIVVGAMAGQIGLIMVTYWGITKLPGFLLAVVIATPFAILFGYLTGKLFNKTKGQEMIAGLIVSFFANGIYQFIFLFLVGTIIPIKNTIMLKPDGIGLRNTISLNGGDYPDGIKYALDGIFRFNLFYFIIIGSAFIILFSIYKLLKGKDKKYVATKTNGVYIAYIITAVVFIAVSVSILVTGSNLGKLTIPVVTLMVIIGLCLFNILIIKTKLGQDFRTIGLSQSIAKVSGINVDRTRIIAIVISTVLAAWGQIIFLQNIGTINTYGSHMQVGMFASAAILIGGASVTKANIRQALLGTVLFHSVFIVSPTAGKALFGDAQIGEFFRAFVVYGVIGISLGLHAWKKRMTSKL